MLMTHPHFSIAIVDSNMLAAIGMQQILADIMPIAEVRVFASFEQLETLKDTPFVHYFVSSRIFFEHAAFFREPSRRVIVLVNGDLQIAGVPTLNVCQEETALVRSILELQSALSLIRLSAAPCRCRPACQPARTVCARSRGSYPFGSRIYQQGSCRPFEHQHHNSHHTPHTYNGETASSLVGRHHHLCRYERAFRRWRDIMRFVTRSTDMSVPSSPTMSTVQTCVLLPAYTSLALPYTLPSVADMAT